MQLVKVLQSFVLIKKGMRFCLNVLHTDPRQSQKRGAEEAGFNELWKGEYSSIYSPYNRYFNLLIPKIVSLH